MRTDEAKSDALLGAMPDTVLVLGKDGSIVEFIAASRESYVRELERGKRCVDDYLPSEVAERWHELQEEVRSTGQPNCFEFELKRPMGARAYFQVRFVPYVDEKVLAIATEFTARKRAEERVRRLAYFDTLTGLPNRQSFLSHLGRMLAEAKQNDHSVAVFYIDLDNFKRINDNLGHSYGDGVLKAIAERLSGCIRREGASNATSDQHLGIARLGGDEFVCAMSGFGDDNILNSVSERIRATLREPVEYRGHEFVVTPSVGIAVYPHDGEDVEELLKNADVAMYQAKGAGRNSVRFYSGTMSIRSMRRLELEGGLRRAIEHGDLELHYQPKQNLSNGVTVGMEALVRWRGEDGDFIPPVHFIPLAEESGLITPLGEWVLHEACRQIREWQTDLGVGVQVAVNISSQQFYQSDLRKTVMQTLFDAKVRPSLLQLELTESLLMRDVQETIDTLRALKDAGVSLAIDDFGTGYSSLSYLKRFPLDLLKIDRSFVAELEANNDDAAICAAIIAMAHQLGLSVVAEGIETREQLEYLRTQGCEYGQGFLFGKPLPPEEVVRAVSRGRARREQKSGEVR